MSADFFEKNGWMVLDLDPEPVFRAREKLEEKLAEIWGKKIPLESYRNEDDASHTEIQIQMTRFFRENRLGPKVIASSLALFQSFLGLDLFVQRNPYLRMTRPFKEQDNIGYHRDTFYGGSPYELSVLVPFVDVPAESSLKVLSGSHVHSEEMYPTHQVDGGISKGSAKHQLGFLYAPKLMDASIEGQMKGIALKMGQCLVFSLSTVHGSRVNTGEVTRWSSDIRVMHALAPVDLSARPDYYMPLSYSSITKCVQRYHHANGQQARDDVELELCHR